MKRLLLYFFIFSIFVTSIYEISYSRDNYAPFDCKPLSALIETDYLLNTGTTANSIVKYNFKKHKIDLIVDINIPNKVKALAENTKYLFAAGEDGLGVYDKQRNIWEKWYSKTVNALAANNEKIWMGTLEGIIELNLSDRKIKKYTTEEGLNQNKIYSLFLFNNYLFVGTYKNGKGVHNDRKGDMFGTGLNRIDLSTGRITNIPIKCQKADIVVDMYPILNKNNTLIIVLGYWNYSTLFELNLENNQIVKLDTHHHHISGLLAKYDQSLNSEMANNLLNYILHTHLNGGLPNPVADEYINILYNKQDFQLLEKLLNSKNNDERLVSIYALRLINTEKSTQYLTQALNDKEQFIATQARVILEWRQKNKK
ncbi:MAG: hypothetical protein Q7K21_06305 [Elusimicrobiota bacterium]|nr:hypothetical protein [Elusimicrobiota bacterium]